MTAKPVHLLWTGGFDSTFRLCQLLIDLEREVYPIYGFQMGFQDEVITSTYDQPNAIQKPAMPHEIQAIENIRWLLERDFPEARSRLKPIRFVPSRIDTHDWREDKKILGPGINQGRQYDLLRMVSERYGHRIELCIEKSEVGHNKVGDQLIPWVEEVDGVWQLVANLPEELLNPSRTDGLCNFLGFSFPILKTTRKEMMQMAAESGYQHILKHTWSCREFRPNRKPCGECFCCLGRRRDDVFWENPLKIEDPNFGFINLRPLHDAQRSSRTGRSAKIDHASD